MGGQGRQEGDSWDPRGFRPPHNRPRLFLPYYEECKNLLSERAGSISGDTSSFNFHRMSEIPDTLYMVREERVEGREGSDRGGRGPLPDQDNVSQMVRRVRKLFRSISVQRALVSPFANRQQIFLQLQLRVVREYNLPDSFSAVLQRAMDGGAAGGDTPESGEQRLYCSNPDWEGRRLGGSLHYVGWDHLPPPSDQPLSDIMPDIALAGATAAFSGLSLSRSVPSHRPPTPPSPAPHHALSPDVLEVGARWSPRSSGARSVPHSYRHGPSHMFL